MVICNLLLPDNKPFTFISLNNHERVCQKLCHGGFIIYYFLFFYFALCIINRYNMLNQRISKHLRFHYVKYNLLALCYEY